MANEYTLGGPPPQSRSEKILMNKNPGPAQSRIEELLKNGSEGRPQGGLVYKGAVESSALLPNSGNEIGDMYHVNSDGSEWAWNGEQWEELGKSSSAEPELPAVTASDNGKSLVVENGAWGKGYQTARTPRVAMTASDTTPTLDPNKLYVFPEMTTLTPTLNTPSDNSIVNEYHFIFTSGATATTLTLPASVLQPDGFTVEANHVYEVSIMEGCMTAQGWAVTV